MAYDENIRIIAEELERVKNRPTGDKLPEVESTDEGKVLTVNSSGEWDAEELPDQLPEVETTDEGKVLTVNSSGKWAAADPSGSYNLDYSTVEVNTGQKWIDGKNVYCIVFAGKIPQTGSSINVELGEIDVETLISITMTVDYSDTKRTLPLTGSYSNTAHTLSILSVAALYSQCDYVAVAYYTKPNPVPSSETKSKKKGAK